MNQLPREELEKLVVTLAGQSVDCGEIIQMEMGSGRLAKPVKGFSTENVCYSGLGHLGKLPMECEYLGCLLFIFFFSFGEL